MARKTYTREFKPHAVRLLTEKGLAVAEAARHLGVSDGGLRSWRDAAHQLGEAAFPGPGNLTPADDERRRRAAVTRRRAERDLLKKAAAYFASPPS